MPSNVPLPVDLVHAMPDPALVVDAQGMVTLANEQAVEVLESDPVGRHLSASLRVPAVLDAVNEAAMGEGGANVDYDVRVPVPRSFRAHVSCLGHGKGATRDQFQFVTAFGRKLCRDLVPITRQHADMIGDGITGGRIGKTVAEGVFVQDKIEQRCQISRVSERRLIWILREHHVVLRDDVGLTE